jgi:hypothetical protein
MIRPGFLDRESRQDLIELARNGSAAHRLARRANALVLLDDGMSCEAIANVLLLDDDTIRTWYRLYEENGCHARLARVIALESDSDTFPESAQKRQVAHEDEARVKLPQPATERMAKARDYIWRGVGHHQTLPKIEMNDICPSECTPQQARHFDRERRSAGSGQGLIGGVAERLGSQRHEPTVNTESAFGAAQFACIAGDVPGAKADASHELIEPHPLKANAMALKVTRA